MKINPYLPDGVYVPDGEPHLFEGRVYLYGSHDRFGGETFCMNDYVCYSADPSDLGSWRCEGVIYRREQDPRGKEGYLYAPDCAKGPDGRYYLYYSVSDSSVISVAVCASPAGKFEYLGDVTAEDGHVFGTGEEDPYLFDPAVLVEGTDVYLYSGSCPYRRFTETQIAYLRNHYGKNLRLFSRQMKSTHSVVMRLRSDMLSMRGTAKPLVPGAFAENPGTFSGHEFFEASSIRKFGDTYYFIYSSKLCHELCWAASSRPDEGFVYGGLLVSNAGRYDEERGRYETYCGNNHGSILETGGQYYVFYHRQTNRSSFSRQGCIEKIRMESGRFLPASLSSTQGETEGAGEYPAYSACILQYDGNAGFSASRAAEGRENHPYITQDGPDGVPGQYIANFRQGAKAVWRSFDLSGIREIVVTIRGSGVVRVGSGYAETDSGGWREVPVPFYENEENEIVITGEYGNVDILKIALREGGTA